MRSFVSTRVTRCVLFILCADVVSCVSGGVRLQLTVVDTPGFGDNIDNTDSWNSVIQNIEAKFEDYLNAESRVNRTAIHDTRVHCCLYFIAPTGEVISNILRNVPIAFHIFTVQARFEIGSPIN